MSKVDFERETAEIISRVQVISIYESMGAKFVGGVRDSGSYECLSLSRPEEGKPSAWVNVATGRYGDSASTYPDEAGTISIFDALVRYSSLGLKDFKEARAYLAQQVNLELGTGAGRKKKENPLDSLDFIDWDAGHEMLVKMWGMKHKVGISLEAVKEAGGRIGYWPCYTDTKTNEKKRGRFKVIALPCYGKGLLNNPPVAWVIYNIVGGDLEKYNGKSAPATFHKVLSIGPTEGTVMNLVDLQKLTGGTRDKIRIAIKTGGPTDMLAIISARPAGLKDEIAIITNASGETGDVKPHQQDLFAGIHTLLIGDADKAGRMGVIKWIDSLRSTAASVIDVTLPYAVQMKHGKDARDFLNGITEQPDGSFTVDTRRTFNQLIAHAACSHGYKISNGIPERVGDWPDDLMLPIPSSIMTDPPSVESIIESLGKPEAKLVAAFIPRTAVECIDEQRICDMLQIRVCGKHGKTGIEVFSLLFHRSEVIADISRLTYEHLLLIAGPPVKQHVIKSLRDDVPGMVQINDVRNAIAMIASFESMDENSKLGAGCWGGVTEKGDAYPSIVLVNAGNAAEFNGDKKLKLVDYPRCRGNWLDFDNTPTPWYDFKKLASLVDNCTPDSSKQVMNELIDLFGKWNWSQPIPSPLVLTGLIFASWVQTMWHWRPQVAIIGPTRSGKTTACLALGDIFGNLCEKSSMSTAAGIRQTIRTSAKIVLCDEFEESRYRIEMLEMLRASGRGDRILRGTSNQKGQVFALRHIVWVAAIEVGLKKEADRNRFITLELARIKADRKANFVSPSPAYLHELGQRSLAVAIRHIDRAKVLAETLKDTRLPGVDPRVIESFSVPAAMLAAIDGLGVNDAINLLSEILSGMNVMDIGESQDESSLIDTILGAQVFCEKEVSSIAQLIEKVVDRSTGWEKYADGLGRSGIGFKRYGSGADILPGLASEMCLEIDPKRVTSSLLKNTSWAGQSIDQILRRVEGAIVTRRRVGSHRTKCVLLPWAYINREFLAKDLL